jgi:hypothetical protein
MNRTILLAAALCVGASPLLAQSFRTVTSSRQRSGEKELNVNVEFAAGTFRLRRENTGALYRSRIAYNEERFRPLADYDDGELRLGLKTLSAKQNFNIDKHEYNRQSMEVGISPDVPTYLDLQFVAGEADVDLGGLNLSSADIKTGASQSVVSFSTPLVGQCESISFQVGAAEFRTEHMGNARCRNIDFAAGAGEITLDFTGDWGPLTSVNADIKVGMGVLKLDLPRDIGVRVEVSRFLSGFDQSGFVKRGDTYYSPNWDAADKKLHVDITAALGNVEVAWR